MISTIVTVIGFLICIVGISKMKYHGEYFSGGIVLIVGLICLSLINPDKSDNTRNKDKVHEETQIKREIKRTDNDTPRNSSTVEPKGIHWIKDNNNVYLWNPQPQDGETITWSGNFVQDGNYRYANGDGVVMWYLNGEFEQKDEGTFIHGQRDGQFKHTFPSGRVDYSNWDNGVEIP